MRLIDADKLPYVNKVILVDKLDGDVIITTAKEYTSYVNDETPTVKAIPIEWIEKYIEDNTSTMVNPKYVDDTYNYIQFTEKPFDYYLTVMPFQVKIMLKKWRQENESNI